MKNNASKAEEGIDRISELPHPILHRILCSLSQRQSIQTSALSKSWRHVGSTRPNITLSAYRDFKGNKSNDQELVVSVLDKTLQSYRDRRLSIDKFDVGIMSVDQKNSIPTLRKWIPVLMLDMRVKVFRLVFHNHSTSYFDLPSVVFAAESLRALYLKRCRVNDCYPLIDKNKILCKHLHTLNLQEVFITEETIEMLLSSCSSIQNLSILHCFGFETLRLVDEPRALKHIDLGGDKNRSVEIDLFPSISTISISGFCLPQHNMYLPRLVRLVLTDVRLSSESLDSFSCDFPCIQMMELFNCSGFKEFNLSSGSIKKLIISNLKDGALCRASIYAPSITSFRYTGPLLESFSWSTTTSSEWRSDIDLGGFYADSRKSATEWFDKLNGLLTELRQSEIYLTVDGPGCEIRKNIININDIIYMPNNNPVEVECLSMWPWGCFDTYFQVFLDCLFCKCRPRYIECNFINSDDGLAKVVNRHFWNVHEILFKELGKAKDSRRSLWQRDLEEASMEAFNRIMKEWRCVQSTSSVKGRVVKFRFRLKWRELRSQGINR